MEKNCNSCTSHRNCKIEHWLLRQGWHFPERFSCSMGKWIPEDQSSKEPEPVTTLIENKSIKCQCREEDKTGSSDVSCCNVCGLPDDPNWRSLIPVTPVAYVPYQLCPKCQGSGIAGLVTCDVCNVAKIIPMHVLKP